ncbi:MAG: hypothetical protein WC356_02640 [Candidatus Micrarchaeia archaeon]|jgi:hypothetical protein
MDEKIIAVAASFFPIRLIAHTPNNIEMEIVVTNNTDEIYWIECDVELPDSISLAQDKKLLKGRTRIGIAKPKSKVFKRVKVYGDTNTYPDLYKIKLTAYGFNQESVIKTNATNIIKLRCERLE